MNDLKGLVNLRENIAMTSNNTSNLSPPTFNGESYQVWAINTKAHLRGLVYGSGLMSPLLHTY